jgi:hypothetical protein
MTLHSEAGDATRTQSHRRHGQACASSRAHRRGSVPRQQREQQCSSRNRPLEPVLVQELVEEQVEEQEQVQEQEQALAVRRG